MSSFSDNVNVDYLLEKRERTGRVQVTQDQADRLSAVQQGTTNVPASVMVQGVKDNADNGFLDSLTEFFSKATAATYGRVKNAVFNQLNINPETGGFGELAIKGGMLGVRAVYEDVIARPIRTIENVQQGASLSEAWKKSAIDPFRYWKEAVERGEKIDLGNALFQATDPEKTETYQELIDKGADPIRARKAAAAQLGYNVFDKIFEEEQKTVFQGDRAAALIARGKSPHATPGRVLFKPFEFIIGPEDKAYDFFTGLVDFGLQLLDPTFLAGKAAKGIKAGSKLLALSDEAADGLGLLNGFVRKSFSRTTAEEVINGEIGNKIFLELYKLKDKPADLMEKTNFSLVNKYVVENKAISDEFNIFTKGLFALEDGLDDVSAIQAVKELITPKVLAVGTAGEVPQIQKLSRFRQSVGDYFGPLYKTRLSGNNPDNLIVEYAKFLRLLDPKDQVVSRNQRVKDMITKLDELPKNPNVRSNAIVTQLLDDFTSLRTIYKDELVKAGTLEKNEKLVDNVFSALIKVVDEQGKITGEMTRYTNLNQVPLGMKKAWKKILKQDEEFSRGVNDETLEEAFDTLYTQPLLETTLSQDIFLANPSEVIKLSNRLAKNMRGRFEEAQKIVGGEGVSRFFDFYVGQLFKPLVLLRPAWTVRVIAEEQLRAVADGVLAPLDHPIGLLARLFDDVGARPSYAQSGWLDTSAWKLGISESTTGDTRSLKALKRQSITPAIKYETVELATSPERWKEGQWRVINNFYHDVLMRKIAQGELVKNKKKFYEDLAKELKEEGNTYRELMLNLTSGTHNPYRILRGSDALTPAEYNKVLDDFIGLMREELRQSLSATGKNVNSELYQVVATGKFKVGDEVLDLDLTRTAKISQSDLKLLNEGKLSNKEADKLQGLIDQATNKVYDNYFTKFGGKEILPQTVKWKTKPFTTDRGFLDRTTENLFKWLMTNPTNSLSRIPVFKSSYWNKSAELIPISSEKVKQKIIKGAREAGIGEKVIKRMDDIKSAGADGIDDAVLIENLAKGFAVSKVKSLLYDITENRRFWEASRWLFPFGNAYQEVITTWLGIVKRNPQVAARFQTTWDGAAQENDTLDPTGKGFFYKNPVNGKVVFNYPGTDLLQNWMFKDNVSETDVRVNMPVYAQSINIAASFIPGFGPVVTFPAAFMFDNFPEESFITRLVFGEFPPMNPKDPVDWQKTLGFRPAWLDKFIKIAFNKGENSQGVFGNTVIDTYKAMLYAGMIDDSTEELAKEGMQKAVDAAKTIFLFRAVSQFLGPAGAASPTFEITDKNFNYFMLETLADEYRTLKISNNYDDALATQKFIETYGINPLPLTVSKTVSIEKRPTTVEGADWMKENIDIYEKYPLVAWYLEPAPIYSEFSYDAYKKALLEGAREYRTPEQWAVAKNKLLGSIALEQYERQTGIFGNNTAGAKALRDAKKKELEQRYWGYGQPGIVGSPTQPSINMQIDQLIKMVNDPDLQNFDTIKSAKLYLEARQQVINSFVAAGLSETIWRTSSKYAGVRAALRNEADKLIRDNPSFGPMFDQLLAREIEPEYEDNLLVQLGLGQ